MTVKAEQNRPEWIIKLREIREQQRKVLLEALLSVFPEDGHGMAWFPQWPWLYNIMGIGFDFDLPPEGQIGKTFLYGPHKLTFTGSSIDMGASPGHVKRGEWENMCEPWATRFVVGGKTNDYIWAVDRTGWLVKSAKLKFYENRPPFVFSSELSERDFEKVESVQPVAQLIMTMGKEIVAKGRNFGWWDKRRKQPKLVRT
jgi:hypothetical protein